MEPGYVYRYDCCRFGGAQLSGRNLPPNVETNSFVRAWLWCWWGYHVLGAIESRIYDRETKNHHVW